MKGDFTRDTFDPAKHFSRVLMQQGRVTLDADFNEQATISLRYLRTLARDIIGPFAAPIQGGGFKLTKLDPDPNKALFRISRGCYYVDGILVENDTEDCTYTIQPGYEPSDDDVLLKAAAEGSTQSFFVYLDVWERHITALEDDSICEKGLGGPDTCTRVKVVWQVKAISADMSDDEQSDLESALSEIKQLYDHKDSTEQKFKTPYDLKLLSDIQNLEDQIAQFSRLVFLPLHHKLLDQVVRRNNPSLAARVDPGQKTDDACITPPASKYRGAENQLYRVEIHHGGKVGDSTPPTFKWSRDNGSVATAWLGEGSDLQVASTRGSAAGNWVELSDDTLELLGQPGTLVQLVKVEGDTLSVDPATKLPSISNFPAKPKVRGWDYVATDKISLAKDNAVPIQESTPEKIVWIDLEDGVQIQFSAGGEYRTGDYWLIPARVATGNVEWPLKTEADGTPKEDSAGNFIPLDQPPHGIEHHYALLGFAFSSNPNLKIENARFEFWPMFFGIADPEVGRGVRVGPDRAAPAAPKKPRKARKRQTKKGPAAPPEGAPS
jgi:Family of unknown function (DUF6519)